MVPVYWSMLSKVAVDTVYVFNLTPFTCSWSWLTQTGTHMPSHDPSKHYKNLWRLTQTTGHLTTHIVVSLLQLSLEHFCAKPARHWCQKCWSREILACEAVTAARMHEGNQREVCEEMWPQFRLMQIKLTSLYKSCERSIHSTYITSCAKEKRMIRFVIE